MTGKLGGWEIRIDKTVRDKLLRAGDIAHLVKFLLLVRT